MISALTHLDHRTGHGAALPGTSGPRRQEEPGFGTGIEGQGLDIRVEAAVPWNTQAAGEQQQRFPSGMNKGHWGRNNLTGADWRQCQCTEGPGSLDSRGASLNQAEQRRIWDPEGGIVEAAGNRH